MEDCSWSSRYCSGHSSAHPTEDSPSRVEGSPPSDDPHLTHRNSHCPQMMGEGLENSRDVFVHHSSNIDILYDYSNVLESVQLQRSRCVAVVGRVLY